MRHRHRDGRSWALALSLALTGCGAAAGADPAYWADEDDPFVFGWLRASELQPEGRVPAAGEICPDEAARPGCHIRVRTTVPCSGACWSPEDLAARTAWICVCDRCVQDADCDARPDGRCEMLPGNTCDQSRRVCLYPGDPCYDPSECGGGMLRCMHSRGRAVCAEPDEPPP